MSEPNHITFEGPVAIRVELVGPAPVEGVLVDSIEYLPDCVALRLAGTTVARFRRDAFVGWWILEQEQKQDAHPSRNADTHLQTFKKAAG